MGGLGCCHLLNHQLELLNVPCGGSLPNSTGEASINLVVPKWCLGYADTMIVFRLGTPCHRFIFPLFWRFEVFETSLASPAVDAMAGRGSEQGATEQEEAAACQNAEEARLSGRHRLREARPKKSAARGKPHADGLTWNLERASDGGRAARARSARRE